jgi:hypothetical protein
MSRPQAEEREETFQRSKHGALFDKSQRTRNCTTDPILSPQIKATPEWSRERDDETVAVAI